MQDMNHHLASERNLFLQSGNGPGDSGLVLSTDAKPRLKWTPELHERFIDAVNQLGGAEKATPKTIMRVMGIPGLTLYHLKSHLQKYRLSRNLQAQANGGTAKNAVSPAVASNRAPEGTGLNIPTHGIEAIQISDAIQMQIEVQRRLHEQLEVQRRLQMQMESQGKYLNSVLQKAQETLGKQSMGGSSGIEAAKLQISELVSKASNECFSSASHPLHPQAIQAADCSMDSCLSSCEGSQNTNMIMRTYHGNSSSQGATQMQENFRLQQIQSAFFADFHGDRTLSQPGFNLSGNRTRKDEQNPGFIASAVQSKCRKEPSFRLACPPAAQLDLNALDEGSHAQNCREFDLNSFSWS
ncbi:Myb family transcription factor APL [Apostasia shenzhenica]|uniref:Myb family transcription factor APL n=1 Tax=Apostasia shenzhenica TaxID=1088818 RepID=A0A2I0BCS3_9ASPA|nr:Myb family transcription factor APL [Apostasia shenzhenica]